MTNGHAINETWHRRKLWSLAVSHPNQLGNKRNCASEGKFSDVERGFASSVPAIFKTLYINNANEEFIVGTVRIITENKRTEAALRITNKNLNCYPVSLAMISKTS